MCVCGFNFSVLKSVDSCYGCGGSLNAWCCVRLVGAEEYGSTALCPSWVIKNDIKGK